MRYVNLITKMGLVMILSFPLFSFGQKLIDKDTFQDENGTTFKVGDDLMTEKKQTCPLSAYLPVRESFYNCLPS